MNPSATPIERLNAIGFLPTFERGRNPITEKQVRPIAAMADWGKQRRMWDSFAREF